MNVMNSPRLGFGLVLLISVGLLAFAYYAQYVLLIEPCPLCILQRMGFMVMAAGAAAGLIPGTRGWGRWVYGAVIGIGGIWGVTTAGRHLWLQSLPADQVPECGPGLEFMLEFFGPLEALRSAFTGAGECAEVDWSLMGLSMPAWTLIWYVALMAIALIALVRVRK